MARPKLNRTLLRLVGDALARGAPVSTFEDDLARKLRVSDRTVRKYAALINEQRDREDTESLKRARRQGRFVALAAAARHLKRADQLYADAGLTSDAAIRKAANDLVAELNEEATDITKAVRELLDGEPQFSNTGDRVHEFEIGDEA